MRGDSGNTIKKSCFRFVFYFPRYVKKQIVIPQKPLIRVFFIRFKRTLFSRVLYTPQTMPIARTALTYCICSSQLFVLCRIRKNRYRHFHCRLFFFFFFTNNFALCICTVFGTFVLKNILRMIH